MERQEFDESWKQAFEEAAYSPSENVWTNIELELEREKASQLKRRLVFYQLLAAASVVFAISVVLGMYTMNNRQKATLATHIVPANNEEKTSTIDPSAANDNGSQQAKADKASLENKQNTASVPQGVSPEQNNGSKANNTIDAGNHKGNTATPVVINSLALTDDNNTTRRHVLDDAVLLSATERKLPSLVEEKKAELVHRETAATVASDPVEQMIARLEKREQELKAESEDVKDEKNNKQRDDEKLWTSVGVAAGSFNSVNSGAPSLMAQSRQPDNARSLASASIADQEAKASGFTYSMGVNLGTKLSERWIFQGGVNYLTQSSDYTQSNVLVVPRGESTAFRAPNIKDIDNDQASAVNVSPYDVNNNVRYLSIPMQAGFLVIDRDLGLQMNAGVATDLFLQNTITATTNGEKVDAAKAGIGEDSALRPVNLSGLLGTEVSYKFGRHYRIALNPGLKYPFNSIYKSDEYKATRLSFDVGLRFRYIFH